MGNYNDKENSRGSRNSQYQRDSGSRNGQYRKNNGSGQSAQPRKTGSSQNGQYRNSDSERSSQYRGNSQYRGGSQYRSGRPSGKSAGGSGYRSRKRKKSKLQEYFPILFVAALAALFIAAVCGIFAACGSCGSCGTRGSCGSSGSSSGEPGNSGTENGTQTVPGNAVSGSDMTAPETEQPAPEPDPIRQKADELLSAMTDEQKIGSLLLVRGDTLTQDEFMALISDVHAGGAVLFKSDFDGRDREGVIAYTSALQSAGGGHMLMCVDEEGGDVVRVSSNKQLRDSRFRSPRRLYNDGGFDNIIADTREKCAFLKGLGLNVNFAPVADVVTDEDGFLYKRAFGGDAQSTAEYVGTVVGIMKELGMGNTIKHFPGYGNAHGDTHEGLVESAVTEDTLRSSDLVPFVSGIQAGADSVMVTHTIVSCVDPERPCSLSPAAVSLLRDELGFDGVIITDGLDMGAIKKYCGGEDPCLKAFLAGCDLMCTPEDPHASYSALLTALSDGGITRERLDDSVRRILIWKIRLGLC